MAGTEESIALSRDGQPPTVIFKKRNAKAKGSRRAPARDQVPSQSDDSFSSGEDSGHMVKRRKKNTGGITASTIKHKSSDQDLYATVFAANRDLSIPTTNDATKSINWFDEDSKGTSTRLVGPVKASSNVRTVTITDFSPDVCKDYKQTGFCGFGESCKFLHAREDYKQGWQLDREWENVTRGNKNIRSTTVASADRNKNQTGDNEEEDERLEGIPFACIICTESYKDPVVTRCGHYFCEQCALKRYRKDPSCAACGTGTNGVFNSARHLKKLLQKKSERVAKGEGVDRQ